MSLIGKEITMDKLTEREECEIVGGRADPVVGMSYESALRIAKELGEKRKSLGTWTQMNQVDYMKRWRNSNKNSKEYLNRKEEIDEFIDTLTNENYNNTIDL